MSRYFKYNYLLPNNFGTRGKFFRPRAIPICPTDEENYLKNLDDWANLGEGTWILEDNVVNMQGAIKIENGQTLCIAQDVLLQFTQDINAGPPSFRVLPGGKLNIYGTLKYIATAGGSAFMKIEGDVLVRGVGSLINTKTGGQSIPTIHFDSGTFVNRGYIKNKGEITIAQNKTLVNDGHIDNTGGTINGSISGSGTCTAC